MKVSRQLIELNLGVFLISTSGIFGRIIDLSPELTIFYRCLLAAFVLYVFIRIRKLKLKADSREHMKYIILGGILMCIHWVSYFYALVLSNIAIAMLTLHIFPALTSLLEPIILKTKFHAYHFLLGIFVLIGIWIILPSFDLNDSIVIATLCGILSAVSYALRNIWTRKIMMHYNASVVMYYHLIIMSVLLLPFLFIKDSTSMSYDWPYIAALALFTTVAGHTLLVNALRHFSAVSVSLISSIIPLYGILWGVIILAEYPDTKTIVGGCFIMASFIIESVASQKRLTKNKKPRI